MMIKCLSCEFSNFGNLHHKISEQKGGELYVLEESIRQNKILPCQLIYPLDRGFGLWRVVYRSLEMSLPIEDLKDDKILNRSPIIYFSWQSFFDLKASAFLALAAHYRSAIQLLRPVLENILVSKYFQEKIRNADEKWEEEYENFLNWTNQEDHEEGFNKSIQYLDSNNIINSEEQERIKVELWDKLNKYVHSYMFNWDKGDNPEIVCFNDSLFNEWFDFYQNILIYLIEMLCHYFPEAIRTENGQNALVELREMESLENECGINLIRSKYLRNFLSKISPEGNLPQEIGYPCSDLGLPNLDEKSELG